MIATAVEMQLTMLGIEQIKRDMADTQNAVGNAMKGIESAVGVAKQAFGMFLGMASIDAFAGMINSSINATGALHDMAIQTGASEAALGQFRALGAYTETSIDSITGAMGKLSKNMVNGTEDSKGAGIALKALGLDFDTIRQMKPEDQMLAIAHSMNNFADGTDKSAAAQALWGKEGAKMLPFIKDLGNSFSDVTAKLTDEEVALKKTQTAMADAFGDNLTAIRKESDSWKRDLATGMTPALYEASQAFLGVTKESGGFKDQIKIMAADGTFADWTRTAITGLTYVMDAFSGLGAVAKSSGIVLAGIAAAATSGDWNAMKSIISSVGDDLDKTWGEQTLGSKLRARMQDIKNVGIASEESKPQLDVSAELQAAEQARLREAEATKAQQKATNEYLAELKKQKDAYEKLSTSIESKILNGEQQLTQGTKINDAQKLENQLYADLANSVLVLTDKQLEETLARLADLDAIDRHLLAQQEEKKLQDEITKARDADIASMAKRNTSLQDENNKIADHNLQLGMSKEAWHELLVQRDLVEIQRLESIANTRTDTGTIGDQNTELTDQIKILRDRAALRQDGIVAQEAHDAQIAWQNTTKSIGDGLSTALMNAVTSGHSVWVAFRDYMVRTILDGAIHNALSSVIQGGINSMMGNLFNLAGSAAGAATGSTGSTALGAANTGSSIANIGSNVAGSLNAGGALGSVGTALGLNSAGFTGGGITGAMGIGASAGTGVTTTAVTTQGAGMVTTDLGILGADTAAAGAGSSAAAGAMAEGGASGMGALAGIGTFAAAMAIGYMLVNANKTVATSPAGNATLHFGADGSIMGTNTSADPGLYSIQPKPERGAQSLWSDEQWLSYQTTIKNQADADMAAKNKTMEGFAAQLDAAYLIQARALGITPLDATFAAGSNTGRQGLEPNLVFGSSVGNSSYSSGEISVGDSASLALAESHAIFAALMGSAVTDAQKTAVHGAFPGFLNGGDFAGGIRLVGESGPELELTGPSRIFDAQKTQQILSGGAGGQSTAEMAAELAAIRVLLMAIAGSSRRTADATNGNPEAPMLVEAA